MFDLSGKNIIITGSNQGIGFELAHKLSNLKCNIIRINKFIHKKKDYLFNDYKFDLNNYEKIPSLINKIVSKFKRIDGLINNAGVSFHNNYSLKAINKTLRINLLANYVLIQSVCKNMSKFNNGSIINITSLGANFGFKLNPGYQISKAGLQQLSRSVAMDWGNKGIRCNSIMPGYIDSGMTKKSKTNKIKYKERLKKMVIQRWGKPTDLVGASIFLLSDESSYVTGIELKVDGGWSIKGL